MKIELLGSLSVKFYKSSKLSKLSDIDELSKKLDLFMTTRSYDDLVEMISVEIICAEPEMDSFYPILRPKYVSEKYKTIHSVLDIHLYKILMFNLKVGYESFYNSNKKEGLRIIAQAILETLETLKYPVKLKEFDKLGFYNDMKTFFIEEGLITVNG